MIHILVKLFRIIHPFVYRPPRLRLLVKLLPFSERTISMVVFYFGIDS
jgi:hypothetical protein